MLDELIGGFDEEVFGRFLNSKFSGSFSAARSKIPVKKEFAWQSAERLGVVKTLAGPNGANVPLLVVAAKLHDGETLKERSSRIKQFKFAKQVLDDAMSNPSPGVDGVLTQGLFVFYDEAGNFRLSLVYGKAEGTKLVWSTAKRLSFHVQAGDGNKTFRDRMALDWGTFDKLKEAFSVEKLTKEFYNRLFNWYQWALSDEMNVTYPNNTDTDDDDREINEHIIRLITRLMFVWFLKQKHLVPDNLFDPAELKKILKTFSPVSGDNYYRAILQNLFFATLNSEIPERGFATQTGDRTEHFDIKTLYRYPKEFAIPEANVLKLFEKIPFLNGGLFECLDRGKNYYDGFSRNSNRVAKVPNRLFFDSDKGLIPLLQQYNFTVEENSPGDEEVALDPELLGKVFENLLGAYNPETNVAARNATGSFYTPREIVNYMVDESLIAHLTGKCGEENEDAIRKLFTDGERPANKKLCDALDAALVTAKILDPACGSGAFPMGILLRMVELLRILRDIPEDASVYDLKLELIENCIYGGDIQCIAVQISKLRFFISLVCEQKPTKSAKDNYGIHTLPNLETKFVAADSLIGLPRSGNELPMANVEKLKKELWAVRHQHFLARTYQEKKDLRKEDKKLRTELAKALEQGGGFDTASAKLMAAWDPYDQNTSAPFSDPEWMFNVKTGFDVVIGNPPYVLIPKKEFVAKYGQSYPLLSGKPDLYRMFVERGITLLKTSATLSFIIPNTLLAIPSAQRLRQHITSKMKIGIIIDLVSPSFGEAAVNNIILQIENSYSHDRQVLVGVVENINALTTGSFEKIEQKKWLTNAKCEWTIQISGGTATVIDKLMSGSVPLVAVIDDLCLGMQVYHNTIHTSSQIKSRYLHRDKKHGKAWIPEFSGRHINGFTVNTEKEVPFVDYSADAIYQKPAFRYFSGPRLILREITGDRLVIGYADREFAVNKSCYVLRSDKLSDSELKALLALLSSRCVAFWVRLKGDKSKQALFPRITMNALKCIPIPSGTFSKQAAFLPLVDRILAVKKADPTADTSALEDEIDELVYELYGLTPEEKEIVKASVSRGGSATVASDEADAEETGVVAAPEPSSVSAQVLRPDTSPKAAPRRRKKTALPPSLPGWD